MQMHHTQAILQARHNLATANKMCAEGLFGDPRWTVAYTSAVVKDRKAALAEAEAARDANIARDAVAAPEGWRRRF